MKIITETDRLILREFVAEDLNRLSKILADEQVMRYSSTGVMTKEQTANLIKNNMYSYQIEGCGSFAVIHKDTNKLIGMCGCYPQEIDGPREIEVVYKLQPNYWGKGLATEALKATINYAHNTLKVNRLVAAIDKKNIPSIKVAEKVGMQYEKDSVYLGIPIFMYAIELKKN